MPRLSIRIDFDDEGRLGPGKVALLEGIAREGSISAGRGGQKIAYKRRPPRAAGRGGPHPPLPGDRAQGAVGHGLTSQGIAGDFPQQTAEIKRYPRRKWGGPAWR